MPEREQPRTRLQRIRQAFTPSDRTLSVFTTAFGLGSIRTPDEVRRDTMQEMADDFTEMMQELATVAQEKLEEVKAENKQVGAQYRKEGVVYFPERKLNRILGVQDLNPNNDEKPPDKPA